MHFVEKEVHLLRLTQAMQRLKDQDCRADLIRSIAV